MPAKKKTVEKTVKKAPKYSAVINMNNEEFKLSGDSLVEAFREFEAPRFIKSMVYVTATTKDKKTDFLCNGREGSRKLGNVNARVQLAGMLEKRLA